MNVEDFLGFKDVLNTEHLNTIDTSIEDKLDKESLAADLMYILDAIMTPIEKDVIVHSFGLNNNSAKAFDAISLLFKISSQKVRKIRNAALVKIRTNPKGMAMLKKYFD